MSSENENEQLSAAPTGPGPAAPPYPIPGAAPASAPGYAPQAGPGYPQGYGYAPVPVGGYAPPPPKNETNVFAIIGLCLVGFGLPMVGAILGHIALSQIKKTGEDGRTLALVAVWAGWVLTGLIFLIIAISIALPLVILSIIAAAAPGVYAG